MKTTPIITPERTAASISRVLNPLSGLLPDALMSYLDAFRRGNLAAAATVWELIERRDDVTAVVAAKRKKQVSHHGWEVVLLEENDLAHQQRAILEKFYNNIEVTSVLDPNERGGVSLLLRQMMDAVGKRYAVHEIVWLPGAAGGLSAELRFCPLWWFEATTGPLRLLPDDQATVGIPLEPDGWMVTVAEGLMEAGSIAWLIKYWTLKDWTLFSKRHGMPWLKGVSIAQMYSPEWEQLADAVRDFADGMQAVFAAGETVEVIETSGAHAPPFQALVDRMDRAIARIWLGSDLGTLSREQGIGASLQGEAAEMLAVEDAMELTETLAKYLSKSVLEYHFGKGCERLAYIKIRADARRDVTTDLQIDTFLRQIGAPMGTRALLERYGRPMPAANEEVIGVVQAPSSKDQAPKKTQS